jgi:predicted HTH domain antitoxin
MSTTEFKVDLPSSLSVDEAKMLLAVKLYEVGKVSIGQAANIAGYSKRAFMEILGRYNVPIFTCSPEELRADLGL